MCFFFFQAEDGIRDKLVTGVQTCALPICQRSIFEMLLPDGDKLWDPTLRRIDEVLQDEGMTDLVVEALGRRWRHSVGRGRPGTPAEGRAADAGVETPLRLEL